MCLWNTDALLHPPKEIFVSYFLNQSHPRACDSSELPVLLELSYTVPILLQLCFIVSFSTAVLNGDVNSTRMWRHLYFYQIAHTYIHIGII